VRAGGAVKLKLEPRGEYIFISPTAKVRVRLGAALAANVPDGGDVAAYRDNITITSSDGSHLVFDDAERCKDLFAAGFVVGVSADLQSPGHWYDPVQDCVYIWPNHAGRQVIKLTGLNTNTLTSQFIAGTGSLQACVGLTNGQGTGSYGKVTGWRSGSAVGLVRIDAVAVAGVPTLQQIVRLG
jgi:hypothetical protein